MDQANFIGGLYELRGELKAACRSTEAFRRKLVGPRPESEGKAGQEPAVSVASLITECRALAAQLNKNLDEHHAMVGDSPDNIAGQTIPQRAYA